MLSNIEPRVISTHIFLGQLPSYPDRTVTMAGIVTDVCLMFPAISAVAEGYDVYAVIDASGVWDKVTRDAAIAHITKAGVKVTTWASVLAEVMDG